LENEDIVRCAKDIAACRIETVNLKGVLPEIDIRTMPQVLRLKDRLYFPERNSPTTGGLPGWQPQPKLNGYFW
jgi:hypothetical protein